MSRTVYCDACETPCEGNQYLALQGWMGKGRRYESVRRTEPEAWEVILRQDIPGLTADLCPSCLQERIGNTPLNPQQTREGRIQELKAEQPRLSGLALLRKTSFFAATTVCCDLCQQDCIEKHVKLTSAWITPANERLTLEICESCVSHHLSDRVRFEQIAEACETRAVR